MDESADDWKSRTALTSLPGKTAPIAEANEERGEDPPNRIGGLGSLLCYACLTTMTITKSRRPGEGSDSVPLPNWVGRRAVEREDIAEFLLEGAEEDS